MNKLFFSFFSITVFFITASFIPASFAENSRAIKRVNAQKNKRIALVIGNSSYKNASLKNPVNDATDMARVLRLCDFEVDLLTDGSQRQMDEAIRTFGKRLRDGGVGLFYFAGHGMQLQGKNYLIPIGAKIEDESDIRFEALDANRILGKMEVAGNELNIVILDACRNNPFARSFRSVGQGLSQMDAPTGSLVAYATAPGSVAADGKGRNGVYTRHLLHYLQQPNLPVSRIFMEVRKAVLKETGKKQTPWESSSLTDNFFFQRKDNSAAFYVQPAPPPKPPSFSLKVEEELWKTVSTSNKVEDIQTYIHEYPNGHFITSAKLKLKQLREKAEQTRRSENLNNNIQTNRIQDSKNRFSKEQAEAIRRFNNM